MDVVEFFSELRQMCKSYSDCTKCPYHGDRCDNAIDLFEKTVEVVEQWSREHPRKTRQNVFLEQWPNARPADDGVLTFCPKRFDFHISCLAECHSLKKCSDCRREFWMKEVE